MAVVSFAKKNAKTTLVACLLLLHLVGPEAKANSQLVSTAQSRDQAAVIFALAAKMVRLSAKLTAHITIRDTLKELLCPGIGTLYQALSADASVAHGKSPIFAVHDELGQVRGPVSLLYNAVENAMGAHDEQLSVIISTQAPTDADLLSQIIDSILRGDNPRNIAVLYTADMEADPFDLETIKQANPALGDFLNQNEVLEQASRAKRLPAQEALYRNYTLNQRVEAQASFVSPAIWKENCGEPVINGALYGGLDLSEVNDLTAFVVVSTDRGIMSVEPTFWLPEDGLEERARQDRVPYDVWAQQGFLRTTPGRSVEYRFVADFMAREFQRRDLRKVAFDRYNMRHLRPWLVEAGISETFIDEHFIEFGQGFFSMSPALNTLESMLLNGRIRHGMHPVLTMCAANAVVKSNEAGGRKLDKRKSRGRIDGMVALAMAVSVASEEMSRKPVYNLPISSILEDVHAG